jgi:antitoxin component of MazEF toxin-antitoxin module
MPDSSGAFVRVPGEILKALGGRARIPIRMKLNGVEHRTSIANMGLGPMIGIPAAVRKLAGVERGDPITLSVNVDSEERTVDLPSDFAKAMRAAERRAYDAMSYTHRKEYVQWIEAAKRPETRARRIALAREKLRERAHKEPR